MRRRSVNTSDLVRNPLLVGAIALMVTIFGVYLSYTANRGLPFVPTYKLRVDVPDAQKLDLGSDVRVGGARVGQVNAITATPTPGGRRPPYAELTLALLPSLGPIAADTTVEIRPASILGAKYVDLVPGRGPRRVPAGGRLPLVQSRSGVELSDAFNIFDRQTTRGLRGTIGGLGDALAGRGGAINDTIVSLRGALPPAQRVLALLVAPSTGLSTLVRGAAGVTGALATVSGPLGELVGAGSRTMAALDGAGTPLAQTLEALPPTESAGTATLRHLQPVLSDAAALAAGLRPGIQALPRATPALAAALEAGVPTLRRTPTLAGDIRTLVGTVRTVAADPGVLGSLRSLGTTDLTTLASSALAGIGAVLTTASDAQLHCNVAALWARGLASVVANGDRLGSFADVVTIFNQGQQTQSAAPAADLHANVYPNENARECEAGNEPFAPGQQLGNPPGLQSTHTLITFPPAAARTRAAAAGLLGGGR